MKASTYRLLLLPLALLATLAASAETCGPLARTAPMREAAGIETHLMTHAGRVLALRLWRFEPSDWTVRVVDMRDQRFRLSENQSYAAPSYSLSELAQTLGNKSVLASAGMTESLLSPLPVGLLKVNGKQKNGIYSSSRLLDGVLCVARSGKFDLLSEATAVGRRVVQDKRIWDACYEAVQAGPMLVSDAAALISTRFNVQGPRVFAGIDSAGRQVLGFVPTATSIDLACALASSELGLREALSLQGDALGGIDFGMHSGVKPADTWGQDHAAIPSALVVTRRKP